MLVDPSLARTSPCLPMRRAMPPMLAAALALGLTTVARAENVLSLAEARALALKSRPELAMSKAALEAAGAELDVAKSGQRPRVAASVTGNVAPGGQLIRLNVTEGGSLVQDNSDPQQPVEGDPVFVGGTPAIDRGIDAFVPVVRYGAAVAVNWNVFDFGRTQAAARAAEAEREARSAELARSRGQLIEAVDAAYLAWLGAHAELDAATAAAKRSHVRLRDLEVQVEEGVEAGSALLPANHAQIAAELRQAIAQEAETSTRLSLDAALGGRLPERSVPDRAILEAPERMTTPNLTTIQVLDAQLRAARARAAAARHLRNPAFGLSAQLGLRGQEQRLFPVYQGGVSMNIPIWDGGEASARARAAEALAEAAAQRKARLQQKLSRAEERRLAALSGASRRVRLGQQLLELAERARADVESRLVEAAATPEELSSADERVARAEAVLLEAKLDRARATLEEGRAGN